MRGREAKSGKEKLSDVNDLGWKRRKPNQETRKEITDENRPLQQRKLEKLSGRFEREEKLCLHKRLVSHPRPLYDFQCQTLKASEREKNFNSIQRKAQKSFCPLDVGEESFWCCFTSTNSESEGEKKASRVRKRCWFVAIANSNKTQRRRRICP